MKNKTQEVKYLDLSLNEEQEITCSYQDDLIVYKNIYNALKDHLNKLEK